MLTKPAKQKQTVLSLGPWKGVRDVGDAGAQDPKYLQDAVNCLFVDPENGGLVSARPGFTRNTASSLATTNGFVQCIHGIPMANGDFYVFAVIDGKVYRQDSTTATTWTDVTPVGPTIDSTARIYAINYNDTIIFSDGSHKPWIASNLTGTPITGTEISLDGSSAWTTRNAPTVYGGKVFFVIQSIAGTAHASRLVWCEEGDATIGYMQSGYTNFWDLFQTGSDRLLGIVGTNTALYYFRKDSIGAITGAVNADFATASTHDAVSLKVGLFQGTSGSLCQPITTGNHVWFLGPDALPHRFRVGSTEIEELWKQMRRRIEEIRGGSGANDKVVARPKIAYSHDLKKVAMLVWQEPTNSNTNEAESLYLFDANSGSYEGRWWVEMNSQYYSASQALTVATGIMDIAGVPIASSLTHFGQSSFMLGGSRTSSNTGGHLWRQTLQRQRTFGDNSAVVVQSITPMLFPDDQNLEIKVDEVAVEILPDTATLSLNYYTPRGSTTGLSATGVASADSIQGSYDHGICRFGLGPNASGRWFRGVFFWDVAAGTAPYGFEKASLKVRAAPLSPLSP